MIMQDIGDEKRALDVFRKALAVNPYLEKVPEMVKSLTEKVEGRDIWFIPINRYPEDVRERRPPRALLSGVIALFTALRERCHEVIAAGRHDY